MTAAADGAGRGWRASGALPVLLAVTVALNAFAYMLVVAIPLPQSDNWRFLAGFLGDFIEHGFSWGQLFQQANASETNQPLYRLFLFFNARYFGLDFRLEGVLGMVCAGAMVVGLVRWAAGRPVRAWSAAECWLLAGIASVLFSLNSTDLYTWPLATLWYLPLLIASGYIALAWWCVGRPGVLAPATFLLGVLLDEVAIPVMAAAIASLWLLRPGAGSRPLLRASGSALAGLACSRLFYWLANLGVEPAPELVPAPPAPLSALLSPQAWHAVVVPLVDPIVQAGNVPRLVGQPLPWLQWVLGALLLLAHGWFWWRVAVRRRTRQALPADHLAVAMMLLCYALVLGLLLQRVPRYGFEYLHQARYVMYYQLHLVALLLMAYREGRPRLAPGARVPAGAALALLMAVLGFALLQFRLGTLAWEHAKYVNRYAEQSALMLGALAADPGRELDCPGALIVCRFPEPRRRQVVSLLVRYRLNLFSPDFQSFHRLHPFPPVLDTPAPAALKPPASP